MTQTFDIRFARSAGLAGLFEAPANEFRWKGAGRLSIDASGISIAVRRGLLTLFARARSHRIATQSLIEVYREGNALRLEFSTPESPRNVLPIWVNDRNAAAQIVTLLPTRRSVELEDGAGTMRRYRLDRRLLALLLFGVAILAAGALLLQRNVQLGRLIPLVDDTSQSSPPLATQDSTVASPASPALTEVGPPSPVSRAPAARTARDFQGSRSLDPAQVPAPSMNTRAESEAAGAETIERAGENSSAQAGSAATVGTVPIAPVQSAREIAYEQLWLFRAESRALYADYLNARDSLAYEQLEAIEARWLAVTSRIVNAPSFATGEFYAIRELELAISRNWRDHLRILAAALRAGGDPPQMELARFHLEFAGAVQAQLSKFGP